MKTTTRFAPSPTGYLHLGNIRTALFNGLLAYKNKGEFVLRIEDTDQTRSTTHFAKVLKEDLAWLNLHILIPEKREQLLQSKRYSIYETYYTALKAKGHAYPCFCTEERLKLLKTFQQNHHQPPGYDGHCRQLSSTQIARYKEKNKPYHLRFKVPLGRTIAFQDIVKGEQQFQTNYLNDFVLHRSNGDPAFLYCNALDDALMGVTHVLRGEDHLSNTAKQLLILEALNLTLPLYGHLPLISHQSSSKPLSKRDNSFSVQSLKDRGYLPHALLNYLARLGHTIDSNALLCFEKLAESFSLERLHKAAAHFDQAQLDFWQKQAVHQQSASEFWDSLPLKVKECVPLAKKILFVRAIQGITVLPEDVPVWIDILFSDTWHLNDETKEMIKSVAPGFWLELLHLFECQELYQEGSKLSDQLKLYIHQSGDKRQRKHHWKLLRLALTNCVAGPELASVIRLLGHSKTTERLKDALNLSCEGSVAC